MIFWHTFLSIQQVFFFNSYIKILTSLHPCPISYNLWHGALQRSVYSSGGFSINFPHSDLLISVLTENLTCTVCSCHVTYAFQSESTLYSCLNVKELLARKRHEIWILSDCNWTRTYNHLVHKQTFNHLAKLTKWLSCVVSSYLCGAFDCMFLSCHGCVSDYTVCIHSETHTWHDKNIQSNAPYR